MGRRETGELVARQRVASKPGLRELATRVCRESCLKRVCRETVVEGDAEQFRHQERLPTQDRRERSDSPPGATADTNEQSEQVRRPSNCLYKQVRRQSSAPSNLGGRAC